MTISNVMSAPCTHKKGETVSPLFSIRPGALRRVLLAIIVLCSVLTGLLMMHSIGRTTGDPAEASRTVTSSPSVDAANHNPQIGVDSTMSLAAPVAVFGASDDGWFCDGNCDADCLALSMVCVLGVLATTLGLLLGSSPVPLHNAFAVMLTAALRRPGRVHRERPSLLMLSISRV